MKNSVFINNNFFGLLFCYSRFQKFIFRVKYQAQKLCEDIDNIHVEKNYRKNDQKLEMTIEFSLVTWFDIYHVLLQTG